LKVLRRSDVPSKGTEGEVREYYFFDGFDEVELIITGRYADPRLIQRADLVTEMLEIKHYYSQGVQARHGIEK